MKRFVTICTAALLGATSLTAAPLCDAFSSADAMPKKYSRLAPVLSGAENDWIITSDQMDLDYAPDAEAVALLKAVASAFEARGSKLAVMMAPPRPLVAGQDALANLNGDTTFFDVSAVSATFSQLMASVNEAGIVAPNLLDTALQSDALRNEYYYRHDTHWTPLGAAESAYALAEAVIASAGAPFDTATLTRPTMDGSGPIHSERGSLADMANAVCGVQVPVVDQAIPQFPSAGLGLLDDTSGQPEILLAGSSFSNRYKKDAYRVADAISGALGGASVVNHSVSGGGAIGAIEGYVLTQPMNADLVVWELPYTEGLRSASTMRQLLGALQYREDMPIADKVALSSSGETKVKLDAASQLLVLELPEAEIERIKVDVRYADGTKDKLNLVRKSRVPSELRSNIWALSLAQPEGKTPVHAKLRYKGSEIGSAPTVGVVRGQALN